MQQIWAMSDRQRNLVMVVRRDQTDICRDFERIAAHCREIDPSIGAFVVYDSPATNVTALSAVFRPTMIFAPQRLLLFHPIRGAIRRGKLLSKSQEYRRLQDAGIPVPEWRLVTRRHLPKLDDLGKFVVTKPDYGGRGADVRIRRASRVQWAPSNTPVRFGSRCPIIAQRFIYTGRWPVSYRVTTLFGRVLASVRAEAAHDGPPIGSADRFAGNSIVAAHRGCSFQLNYDEEIIALGERAHRAFPEIPLLGVDILREQPSGKLFVSEVNATGDVWNFSSEVGLAVERATGTSLAAQFSGLSKAAEILVEETLRQAR